MAVIGSAKLRPAPVLTCCPILDAKRDATPIAAPAEPVARERREPSTTPELDRLHPGRQLMSVARRLAGITPVRTVAQDSAARNRRRSQWANLAPRPRSPQLGRGRPVIDNQRATARITQVRRQLGGVSGAHALADLRSVHTRSSGGDAIRYDSSSEIVQPWPSAATAAWSSCRPAARSSGPAGLPRSGSGTSIVSKSRGSTVAGRSRAPHRAASRPGSGWRGESARGSSPRHRARTSQPAPPSSDPSRPRAHVRPARTSPHGRARRPRSPRPAASRTESYRLRWRASSPAWAGRAPALAPRP